jgi:hypothetical protein
MPPSHLKLAIGFASDLSHNCSNGLRLVSWKLARKYRHSHPLPRITSPRCASAAALLHCSPICFLPPTMPHPPYISTSPSQAPTGMALRRVENWTAGRGEVSEASQPSRQGLDPSEAAGRWLFQPLTGAHSIPPTMTWFGKKVIVAELGTNVFPLTANFRTLNPWVPLHMHICGHILHLLGFSSLCTDETG